MNFDALLGALDLGGVSIPKIALPIGVSFIVFEKITYLVDVYRGVTAPARSVSLYALYVFFFPKLLAGPIVKYHDIAGQMEACPPAHVDDFVLGFSRFMLGVIKKVLLADALAGGADLVFAHDPAELGFVEAWAGVIFFTFQIYFDFSGYSDMAIGLARMFGFRLLENFDEPYIATTMTEFWRRWHMSLTGWIREYLYFPLGGNRRGALRTHFNLWLCFLASGLWHGAAWNYIAWGAYNGLFLVLDRLFLARVLGRLRPWEANIIDLFHRHGGMDDLSLDGFAASGGRHVGADGATFRAGAWRAHDSVLLLARRAYRRQRRRRAARRAFDRGLQLDGPGAPSRAFGQYPACPAVRRGAGEGAR